MKATLKEDGNGCQGGERGAFEGLGLALRLSVCQLAKKSFLPLLLARCCLCHNHHGCEIVIVQIMVEKDDDGGADYGDIYIMMQCLSVCHEK